MSLAIEMDERQAAAIPEIERCRCCSGTGNMLLSWFFRCLACNGDGRTTRGPEVEREAEAEFSRQFTRPAVNTGAAPDAK